jgi:hypothetical protein
MAMPISRPFLIALLGAVLVGATFLAFQNMRDASEGDPAPDPQQVAEPAKQAPAAEPSGMTAEDALAAAFAGDQKVESGQFSVRLSAEDFEGAPQIDGAGLEVGGRFQGKGPTKMPEFDIDMKIAAGGERMKVGAISVGERGYVTQGERAYEVPQPVMTSLAGARARIAEYAGEPQPKLSVAGVDIGGLVTDPEVVGTESMDGVEVTHVEGKLDPSSFVDQLSELGAGSALPEGDFLDQAAKNRALIERVLGEPEVDVYVGEDRILRRLAIEADLNLAAVAEGAGGPRDGKVLLDARFSEVNKPQQIAAPERTSGSLRDAFERSEALNASSMMGLGALMIQQPGLAGARADNFGFARLTGGAASFTDNPQRAARAIKAGKKVVILFHNPDAADDRLMRRVVRQLAARTQAVVLTDHVDTVDRYGKMVEDLGISQTPAVVLIDRTGQARLIEGYVDTDTLAQAVADAR